ncbi:hypothetical protein BCR36DRAFT_355398 [Piromyces finnis]|uniref:Uncharacterized protein n=1 Tax=Piromyces finnis TaxID=1754191 RepID=A0A1Y1V5T8_9FUNG|nr:hypothetical protein BCR36DRAFT_355398 [Piromyces finnis]|eukprot:ORX47911.1 hypothetical protein BCR36DRAFT_355398 [Piromyces finnis]
MKTTSKDKLMDNEAPPPSYNSTENLNEKPPGYSEYPPRPQMGTEHIELPEDRNAVDEQGRPIHCYRGGAHEWEESYSGWGICLALFCCPCGGIYCCHKLKDAKCKKCGYIYKAFDDDDSPPHSDPAGERARRIGFAVGYFTNN